MSASVMDRRLSRISTSSDVPGSELPQSNKSTFMGVLLTDLRTDDFSQNEPAIKGLQDYIVLPKGGLWCRAPSISDLQTWSKVQAVFIYHLTAIGVLA